MEWGIDDKEATWREMINYLQEHRDDYLYKCLPILANGYQNYVDSMMELISYQKKITGVHEIQTNLAINIIRGYRVSIRRNREDRYIVFENAKEQFWKEYPQLIDNGLKETIDNLQVTLNTLLKKMVTLEQFQANILDKMTVFAEMIDSHDSSNPPIYNSSMGEIREFTANI